MPLTAQSLQAFYGSRLGQIAAGAVKPRLAAAWESVTGLDVLGLGFPLPFLEPFAKQARRCVVVMPEDLGAIAWCTERGAATALSAQARLPLLDNVFDRVLVAHGLEECEVPQRFLREIWRVMAPEGRLIVLVPNRAGLWARSEAQPFGHGRPYSRGQLAELLRDAAFEPLASARALFALPWSWPPALAMAKTLEDLGASLALPLGGVLLMEAIKRQHIAPAQTQRGREREAVVSKVPQASPACERTLGSAKKKR